MKGTGSGLRSAVGFGIISIEPLHFAIIKLVTQKYETNVEVVTEMTEKCSWHIHTEVRHNFTHREWIFLCHL